MNDQPTKPIDYPSIEYFADTDTLAIFIRPAVGTVEGIERCTPNIIFFKDQAGRLTEIMVDVASEYVKAPEHCTVSQAVRAGLGLSQQAFADLLGIDVENVYKWDTGIHQPTESAVRLMELAALQPDVFRRAA